MDFPAEATERISNPVNYEKVRKNKEFQYVFKTNSRGLRYNDIPAEKPAMPTVSHAGGVRALL